MSVIKEISQWVTVIPFVITFLVLNNYYNYSMLQSFIITMILMVIVVLSLAFIMSRTTKKKTIPKNIIGETYE